MKIYRRNNNSFINHSGHAIRKYEVESFDYYEKNIKYNLTVE